MKSHGASEIKELKKAAKKGDVTAQFNLGLRYANGFGVPKSDIEAAKYYTQVVEKDSKNRDALFDLGFMYANGRGVKRDEKRAMELFSKASALEHPDAELELGFLFLHGAEGTSNEVAALECFRKAFAQGNLVAQAQVKILERRLAKQDPSLSCESSPTGSENRNLARSIKEEDNAIITPRQMERKNTLHRRAMLQRTDWLQKNPAGNIFHRASKNVEVFKTLLEMVPSSKKDILLKEKNLEGNTPLHLLAYEGQQILIEKTIEVLEIKARPTLISVYNDKGYLPIHAAAESGKKEAIDALIKFGADINALTKGGLTVVHCAQQKNHTELAKDLNKLLNTAQQEKIAENAVLKPLHSSTSSSINKLEEDCIDDRGIARINLLIPYDKLEIEEYLDKGSFGEVHKGKYLDIEVAIKVLFEPRKRDEMLREAGLMIQLIHPNVVRLYGIVLEPQCCIVLEFMQKGSLYALLHSTEELSWSLRWGIIVDIVRGLAYLHENKILHRDIKSLNILLNKHNEAKISDFGLSTAMFFNDKSDGNAGTFHWMAPELFRGNDYDFPCDVYSLAIILWEIMTRCNPYEHTPMPALIIRQVLRGERLHIPEDAPLLLKELTESCWDDNPDKRPKIENILASLHRERVKDFTARTFPPKEPSSDEKMAHSYFSLCSDEDVDSLENNDRKDTQGKGMRAEKCRFFAPKASQGQELTTCSSGDCTKDTKQGGQESSASQNEAGFFASPIQKTVGLALSQSQDSISKKRGSGAGVHTKNTEKYSSDSNKSYESASFSS